MSLSKALALAINRIVFLKDREKYFLSQCLSSPNDIAGLSLCALSRIIGRRPKIETWEPAIFLKEAEEDYGALERGEFEAIVIHTPEYPEALSRIYDPPFLLYCRGEKKILSMPSLAIVGTRDPSPGASAEAFRWGAEASGCGLSVVSGLARGVDAAAHKGAVAAGGKTLAVLGSGIDSIYPQSNKRLAMDILNGNGALISEFHPGTGPLKYNFPKRNRIISGLCPATLLIQAPKKSGALITADFALEQDRDVYVERNCLDLPRNEGCKDLCEQGAKAVGHVRELDFGPDDCYEIPFVRKSENGNCEQIARQMELELTDRILRYKNYFLEIA